MDIAIDCSWKDKLTGEFSASYFTRLMNFVESEYRNGTVFPPRESVFRAFNLCPFEKVKVVIVGQDPYHDDGQANGLCFAVDVPRLPPSLVNIFKELRSDLGREPHTDATLLHWVEQGVFLLNATLTVRAHKPASHARKGWEQFTDAALRRLSQQREDLVYILWGSYAQKKGSFLKGTRNLVIESPHPSPLSAHRGFFGSKPFSRTNDYLSRCGKGEIDW
ncbi:MAG TPA: uracil-DNA glycosylase [Spirochaetota bacterium]